MKQAQLLRYRLIDGLLHMNGDGIPSADLLAKVNDGLAGEGFAPVGLRQLQKDLRDLRRQAGAPIVNTRGARAVRYAYPSYRLFADTMAGKPGDGRQDPPGRRELLRLWNDVATGTGADRRSLGAIDFDDNPALWGIRWLPDILEYILRRTVISIEYDKAFEGTSVYILSPQFLRQYAGRWYLFAWSTASARKKDVPLGIQSYALDRIRSMQSYKNHPWHPYHDIPPEDIEAYKEAQFGHIVGLTKPAGAVPVTVEITFRADNEARRMAALLKTMPPFRDTTFIDEEDGTKRAVLRDIIPNRELENELLLYAHAGHVSDDTLRKALVKRAREIINTQLQIDE